MLMGYRTWRLGWVVLGVLLGGKAVLAADFSRADGLIATAIDRGLAPGAVLLVGRGDQVVYRQAYVAHSVQPRRKPITVDTVFDLASLSKPVGCATSIMILSERGKLNVKDPVANYLPAFAANGKEH